MDTFFVPASEAVDPPERPIKSVRLVYDARIVGGELRHEVDGSTDEARWIPLSEVSSLPRVSLVDAAIALRSERV